MEGLPVEVKVKKNNGKRAEETMLEMSKRTQVLRYLISHSEVVPSFGFLRSIQREAGELANFSSGSGKCRSRG